MTTLHRRQRPPYMPLGVTHQGRHPDRTEPNGMGVDDDSLSAAKGIVLALITSLAIWGVSAAIWVSLR